MVTGTVDVGVGDTAVSFTHGFNQPGLVITLLPLWNTVIFQTFQDDTSVTFAFSNPAPADLTLTYIVAFS